MEGVRVFREGGSLGREAYEGDILKQFLTALLIAVRF